MQTSDGNGGCLQQNLLPPASPSSSFPAHFFFCLPFCPDFSVPLSIHLSAIQTVSQPVLSFYLVPRDLHLNLTHTRSPQVTCSQWRVLPPVSDIFFAHGLKHSRGVMILFRPSLSIEVTNVTADKNGRFITVNTTVNEYKFCLINIYFPNEQNQQISFYQKITDSISWPSSRQNSYWWRF